MRNDSRFELSGLYLMKATFKRETKVGEIVEPVDRYGKDEMMSYNRGFLLSPIRTTSYKQGCDPHD